MSTDEQKTHIKEAARALNDLQKEELNNHNSNPSAEAALDDLYSLRKGYGDPESLEISFKKNLDEAVLTESFINELARLDGELQGGTQEVKSQEVSADKDIV